MAVKWLTNNVIILISTCIVPHTRCTASSILVWCGHQDALQTSSWLGWLSPVSKTVKSKTAHKMVNDTAIIVLNNVKMCQHQFSNYNSRAMTAKTANGPVQLSFPLVHQSSNFMTNVNVIIY